MEDCFRQFVSKLVLNLCELVSSVVFQIHIDFMPIRIDFLRFWIRIQLFKQMQIRIQLLK
jgi:hypothetical protein